ncbi:hypothetical protein CWB41_13930 [Methylovirgula ligni]|uniref:hypothetical protein n=1 Tax=Methylovirgula ligni TaxID=569860 RepID=UPI000E273EDB|nr:hypothetical protein [Methylovirgula ligni]QAY96692.1 hypothetical protein CWB41_13930 [Methylovirgula ligni]
MSYQAQNLFGALYVGGVSRKAILQACANYADDEMRVFAKNATLARDTDQSEASARRRLHELEALGIINRIARYVDENGKVNANRRGRRINDEIRLQPDVTQADLDRRAKELNLRWPKDIDASGEETGDGDIDDEVSLGNLQGQNDEAGTFSPTNLQGLNDEAAPISPTNLQGQPSHCCKGTDESIIESNPPKSPLHDESEPAPEFEEFERTWPWTEGEPREPARRAFCKLAATDRSLAIRGIGNFLAFRQRKNRGRGSARAFLRDRAWEGFGTRTTSAEPSGQVWIVAGTLEGDAWSAHHRAATGRPLFFFPRRLPDGSKSVGLWKPTAFPPNARAGPSDAREYEGVEF